MTPDLELWLLVLVSTLATFVWRGGGLLVSRTIGADGAVMRALTCIAYATLAALISRIVFLPAGILEASALWERLAAAAIALALFFATGMNLLVGVVAGGAALVAIVALAGGV